MLNILNIIVLPYTSVSLLFIKVYTYLNFYIIVGVRANQHLYPIVTSVEDKSTKRS